MSAIPNPALLFLKPHEKSPTAQQLELCCCTAPKRDHRPEAGNPDCKNLDGKRSALFMDQYCPPTENRPTLTK